MLVDLVDKDDVLQLYMYCSQQFCCKCFVLEFWCIVGCYVIRLYYNKFFIIVYIEVYMYICVDMLIFLSDYMLYVMCYMFFLKF